MTTAINARMNVTGFPAHSDVLVAKWAKMCRSVAMQSFLKDSAGQTLKKAASSRNREADIGYLTS
jgi:hypothetical protein